MSYHHLSRKERGKIALLKARHKSIREIARCTGRSPSTISREICRNREQEKKNYSAETAHKKYHQRRTNAYKEKLLTHPDLCDYVVEKLKLCWSPEQIANRLPLDYPQDNGMRLSHNTIYRWLHNAHIPQAAALHIHLRHHGHRHGETRGKYHGIRELKQRSKDVLKRKRVGDWEVDTILSADRKNPACLLSLCERKSRFCGLVLLKHRSAKEAMQGFTFFFGPNQLPLETITADRGKEFACYDEVERRFGIPFYFTRPSSPWQKGSVENLNGLVRQFFPKGTNFKQISPESVQFVMDSLNNRPRKCLQWKTPAEVLADCCT